EDGRGGVMLMLPRTAGRWSHRGHDVGANRSHQPHVVTDGFVAPPFFECLLYADREPEVDRARKVLFGAVEPVECRELLCTKNCERLEYFRTDFVLPAVAARRGRKRRPVALATIEHHQQPIVLV